MIDAAGQQKVIAVIPLNAPNTVEPVTARAPCDIEASRSVNSLLLWTAYLPYECVESLINMDRHRDT